MSSSSGESARAEREARDAVVSRPRGSKSGAIEAALRRYLSAATYEEHRKNRRETNDDEKQDDQGKG